MESLWDVLEETL